ncbi:hypothetical protein FCOIX_13418 [Fusarium coicis]|nr:hypothetical protein FCOIX_13418 [Fusarium coicis]
MIKLRLTNISSTKKKEAPMLATSTNGLANPPRGFKLHFRPHDGSEKVQERDLVIRSSAWLGSQLRLHLHTNDFPVSLATLHADRLFDNIVAAFRTVEQTMATDLVVKLIQAVAQLWKTVITQGPIGRAKVRAQTPYRKLTGLAGPKQLYYPYWFFMAVWLGPGHPFLKSIRRDMSDLWGVEFPTDAIMCPKFIPIEAQMELFYGRPAKPTTPDEASIEERAKAIKKTINESSVNGLSAAIKDHLPNDLNGLGDSTRMQLESNLTSTNRELKDARKQINDLEKQLADAKASQARAQEKTNSDMETLRNEIKQLKGAQGSTNKFKKVVETLRGTVASLDAKVLVGEKKVEQEMNALRSEVAQSAEKAEKAVETGALVLSVLSTPGGQKRKMDEIS